VSSTSACSVIVLTRAASTFRIITFLESKIQLNGWFEYFFEAQFINSSLGVFKVYKL
jgi:hypothetical protein